MAISMAIMSGVAGSAAGFKRIAMALNDPTETLCSRATLVWQMRSKSVRHDFAAHNSANTLPSMTGVGFTFETCFVLFGA
jgi:hypothetical protein